MKEVDSNQTFGAFMMVFRSDKNRFVHQLLNTKRYMSQISENLGARINQITSADLSSFKFFFPQNYEEIQKIASFLDLLDERIATQNKIIDKLESLIKGITQRIVHGNKPNTQITNCLKCSSSSLQESEVKENGIYPVYGANGIVGYLDNYSTKNEAIYIIKDGSGVGSVSYVKGECSATGTLNILEANKDFSLLYLYYILKIFNFNPYRTGMAIPHIYFKDYSKAKFFCPPYEKQVKYAKLLSAIEEKLITEQKILDSINSQKQYLLRQMFI